KVAQQSGWPQAFDSIPTAIASDWMLSTLEFLGNRISLAVSGGNRRDAIPWFRAIEPVSNTNILPPPEYQTRFQKVHKDLADLRRQYAPELWRETINAINGDGSSVAVDLFASGTDNRVFVAPTTALIVPRTATDGRQVIGTASLRDDRLALSFEARL